MFLSRPLPHISTKMTLVLGSVIMMVSTFIIWGEESQNLSKDARPVLPFLSECGFCLRSPLNGSFWRQRVLLALINCSYVPWTYCTPKANCPSDTDPQDQQA